MSETRIFNNFKRRLLAGEVAPVFDCSAYLMNSHYEEIYDNLQYMRSIDDFSKVNSGALNYDIISDLLVGSALTSGYTVKNDYYHAPEDDTDEPVFVTSANSGIYFKQLVASDYEVRTEQLQSYIVEYGGFFIPKKVEELRRTAEIVNAIDCERFAVVLAGEISNLTVDGALFGLNRSHPFKGVFDGNGYAIHINNMQISKRSNGLFGFIAEEGIVRNLSLTHAKIPESEENQNGGVSAITVNSNQYISLDTIKQGLGDVSYGILAGTNNGLCENVTVSADIMFTGRLRPNVYFVANKSMDDETIVTLMDKAWQQLNITAANASDAVLLSSFSNFCYPTQLCLNSRANLIPYVGYFNEGLFASASNLLIDSYDGILYQNDMSAMTHLKRDNTCVMCGDIYNVYKEYCDEDRQTYNIENTDDLIKKGSFRLGPNNRAIYLFGGVFGSNNGYCHDINYIGTFMFDANAVRFCRWNSR